jgi:hypothetical protein
VFVRFQVAADNLEMAPPRARRTLSAAKNCGQSAGLEDN